MKETKIAQRYAKALFDFALEQNQLEKVNSDMSLLAATCAQNKDLIQVLNSPILKATKKLDVLKAIFETHFQKMSLQFLQIVITKKREAFVNAIADQFVKMYKIHIGLKEVEVISAEALTDEFRQRLIAKLQKDLNSKVELKEKVDPNLIGGFVLTVDDKQIDKSLRRRFTQMQKEFDSNVYQKGF